MRNYLRIKIVDELFETNNTLIMLLGKSFVYSFPIIILINKFIYYKYSHNNSFIY